VAGLIGKLRELRRLDKAMSESVRHTLIEGLFASSTSLAMGVFVTTLTCSALAFTCRDGWLALLALALAVTGALRLAHLHFHRPAETMAEARRAELPAGAWLCSMLLGLMGFLAMIRSSDGLVHAVALTICVGYAGSIAGRSAARPGISIIQIVLACLPPIIGLSLEAKPLTWVLAVVCILFLHTLTDIALESFSAMLRTISASEDQKLLAARFEQLARHDGMTGIENRGAFQERLHSAVARRDAEGASLAVLWLDLDKFKEINDTLGHPSGDQVLCTVAATLAAVAEGRGHVARFGGDEFVLLVEDCDKACAAEIAAEILRRLAVPVVLPGATLPIGASIGAAISGSGGADGDTLLHQADIALYHAKANGRNGFHLFEPGMASDADDLRALEAALRDAVDQGAFEAPYQPIVQLASGRVTGCEALLRWHHPDLGTVSPAKFIPVAENIGLIGALTRWMLHRACADAAAWPGAPTIAVNVSPSMFKDLRLLDMVLSALAASGLPARRLELEVTEGVLLADDPATHALIQALQNAGVSLSIDDFGTGYSSLTYLMKYRFEKIKIDTSFTASVTQRKEARAIVHAVVELAGKLDMEVIVEGIETAAQLSFITSLGCTSGQGFLLGRPVPERAIHRRLDMQQHGQKWLPKRAPRPGRWTPVGSLSPDGSPGSLAA
jgi:diguanylate cyclase (GGDEF)-like protein